MEKFGSGSLTNQICCALKSILRPGKMQIIKQDYFVCCGFVPMIFVGIFCCLCISLKVVQLECGENHVEGMNHQDIFTADISIYDISLFQL